MPRFSFCLCITFFALTCQVWANERPPQTIVGFESDDVISQALLQTFLDSRKVAQYRVVAIDSEALASVVRSSLDKPFTFSFPLLDESPVLIRITQSDEPHEGWKTGIRMMSGAVVGDELSTFLCLIEPDGAVHITIRTETQRFAIRKSKTMPYHFYYTLAPGFERIID